MAKNNQKKEKAKRNLENARRYKKKPLTLGRRRFGGPRPPAGGGAEGSAAGGDA
jgi:hypothetical protein